MASLLIERLPSQNRTSFLAAVRAIELLLLSAGVIYAVSVFRDSAILFRGWFSVSSPLCICVFIHLVVVLIAISSLFHRPKIDTNTNSEMEDCSCDTSEDNYDDLHGALSPSVYPNPISPVYVPTTQGGTQMSQHETHFPTVREQTKYLMESVQPVQINRKKNGIKTETGSPAENQMKQELENDGEEEGDTMEATWRAIMKRKNPQEKQLQKSDTFPTAAETSSSSSSSRTESVAKELKKSTTFNDAVKINCRGGLIRRDPSSMNVEELNQRVDEFIQKFNREMRLQRQESDERNYFDMISRGL